MISGSCSAWGRRQAAYWLMQFTDTCDERIEVICAKPSGQVKRYELPLLPADHELFKRNRRDWLKRYLSNFLEVKFLDAVEAGYLAYRSCIDRTTCLTGFWYEELKKHGLGPEDVPDMEETCWQLFADMKARGFKNLILDLRGNEGGNSSVAQVLFKYLTRKPLRTFAAEVKVSEPAIAHNSSLALEPMGSIKVNPSRPLEYPYRSRLSDEQLASLQQFTGEVYVLIDTDVFSSGEWLAAEIAANDLGIIIGEPTGGGGSVPGDQISIELPNTRLLLQISYKFFRKPQADEFDFPGVLPDYWVRQSLADYRAGRDSILEFTLNMIRSK